MIQQELSAFLQSLRIIDHSVKHSEISWNVHAGIHLVSKCPLMEIESLP